MESISTTQIAMVDTENNGGSLPGSFSLEMRNVSLEVSTSRKTKPKVLLEEVNAKFNSSKLSALMGPSGAGKTTLLNVLAGNMKLTDGEVYFCGRKMTTTLRGYYAYTPQDDILFPGLTPRQALKYSARLYLKKKAYQIDNIVNDMIESLQLESCADRKIGDAIEKGISGGEKKRTSIGLDLISERRILFVDEPTSGLDSKLAQDVIKLLKETSRQNRIVITVIHQPSQEVFEMFDSILLLNRGGVVYHGNVDGCFEFFENHVKLQIMDSGNPVDRIFEQMQKSETNLLLEWKNADHKNFDNDNKEKTTSQVVISREKKTTMFNQFAVLAERSLRDNYGDKSKFQKRIIRKLTIYVLIGVVFVGQADGTSVSSFVSTSALFALFFLVIDENLLNTVSQYPLFLPFLIREYRNGVFDLATFVTVQMLIVIVVDLLFAIFVIPPYFLIGFQPTKFGIFYLIIAFSTAYASAAGLLMGASVADVRQALQFVFPFLVPQVLFCGFLIPISQIPVAFRWIYDISFLTYSINAALINEFEELEYSDCSKNETSTTDCFATGREYLEDFGIGNDTLERNLIILTIYTFVVVLVCIVLIAIAVWRKANKL